MPVASAVCEMSTIRSGISVLLGSWRSICCSICFHLRELLLERLEVGGLALLVLELVRSSASLRFELLELLALVGDEEVPGQADDDHGDQRAEHDLDDCGHAAVLLRSRSFSAICFWLMARLHRRGGGRRGGRGASLAGGDGGAGARGRRARSAARPSARRPDAVAVLVLRRVRVRSLTCSVELVRHALVVPRGLDDRRGRGWSSSREPRGCACRWTTRALDCGDAFERQLVAVLLDRGQAHAVGNGAHQFVEQVHHLRAAGLQLLDHLLAREQLGLLLVELLDLLDLACRAA